MCATSIYLRDIQANESIFRGNRHEHNVLQLYKEADYFSVRQDQDFVCVCVKICNFYLWNKIIILYNNSTFFHFQFLCWTLCTQQTLTAVRHSHNKSHFWFLLSKDRILPGHLQEISPLTCIQVSSEYAQTTVFFPNVPNWGRFFRVSVENF